MTDRLIRFFYISYVFLSDILGLDMINGQNVVAVFVLTLLIYYKYKRLGEKLRKRSPQLLKAQSTKALPQIQIDPKQLE